MNDAIFFVVINVMSENLSWFEYITNENLSFFFCNEFNMNKNLSSIKWFDKMNEVVYFCNEFNEINVILFITFNK